MEKIPSLRYRYIQGSQYDDPFNIWSVIENKINEIIEKINELEKKQQETK